MFGATFRNGGEIASLATRLPWDYAKNGYTCFAELEKVYDRIPREKLQGM